MSTAGRSVSDKDTEIVGETSQTQTVEIDCGTIQTDEDSQRETSTDAEGLNENYLQSYESGEPSAPPHTSNIDHSSSHDIKDSLSSDEKSEVNGKISFVQQCYNYFNFNVLPVLFNTVGCLTHFVHHWTCSFYFWYIVKLVLMPEGAVMSLDYPVSESLSRLRSYISFQCGQPTSEILLLFDGKCKQHLTGLGY